MTQAFVESCFDGPVWHPWTSLSSGSHHDPSSAWDGDEGVRELLKLYRKEHKRLDAVVGVERHDPALPRDDVSPIHEDSVVVWLDHKRDILQVSAVWF